MEEKDKAELPQTRAREYLVKSGMRMDTGHRFHFEECFSTTAWLMDVTAVGDGGGAGVEGEIRSPLRPLFIYIRHPGGIS